MRLAPNDEQRSLTDMTGDALAIEAPFDRWFRGDLDAVADEHRLITFGAELGWMGVSAPAAVGGSGSDLVDEVLIFGCIGAKLAPIALSVGAIAAHAACAAGEAGLASAIIAGTTTSGLWVGGDDGSILGGVGSAVAIRVDEQGLTLFDVSASAKPATVGFDWTTSAMPARGTPRFSLRSPDWRLRLELLAAAQLVGLAQTAVEESNGYAKLREQFGRPIGSFQAVRHRIADMELRARRSEAQVWMAAVSLRDGRPDRALQVLSALLVARDAAQVNAEVNIQNHGAIGATTENIGHLLLKRALLWTFITGTTERLLDRIGGSPPQAI